ncbi:MAG: phage holin [Clostridiales bacterium]|nr:phage holin [Clostridiales bacterium]
MKINWRVRYKNKTWLLTFIAAIVSFGYSVLGMFGIVPKLSQDNLMQGVTILITLLTSLGVIIDPTTKGIADSQQALTYTEPKSDQ